jgi:hypothetical protein
MQPSEGIDPHKLDQTIREAKRVAIAFRAITGRPLGITGEIAEYEAARLLNLRLADVRQSGFDAFGENDIKVQIKGRCLQEGGKKSQRVGKIQLDKDWDIVLLVILDPDYETLHIYQANRATIKEALERPGSKARNERGALAVSQFKAIGRQVWPIP